MNRKWFLSYLMTIRIVFSVILTFFFFLYVQHSFRWEVMWDTSIMHYVNFLMAHDLTPYRNILDNNLPGSYYLEGWAMQIFGSGDVGWRFYDYFLLIVLIASLIIVALPYDWFAGLLSGVLFAVLHGAQGPRNAAQREQVMTTLMIAAYAVLFTGLRRAKCWMLLPFGFLMGLAASLKPTAAPLALVLLGMAVYSLRQRAVSASPYFTFALAGLLAALSLDMAFLVHYRALADFIEISKHLTGYYASIGDSSLHVLIFSILTLNKSFFLLIGALLTILISSRQSWENWERAALLVGLCFGFASYILQRKPFEHHESAFVVFLFAWVSIEAAKAWKSPTALHFIGLGYFALIILKVIPYRSDGIQHIDASNPQTHAIIADLQHLGGASLQYQVQCFDLVDGCYSALNRLNLMPYSTFMGDYMFFPPVGDPALPWARDKLAAAFSQRPPRVIVLTNMWLASQSSFQKLDRWPEMASFVEAHYTLEDAHAFSGSAYRFYVLKTLTSPANPIGSSSNR